ncbi:hypothetical protein VPHD260_0179 [Vibrio phage D260]
MDKDKTEKLMKRMVDQYLDKHGTEGYEDFKKFMRDKGIDNNGAMEFYYKRISR